MHLNPGDLLNNRYRMIEVLGQGGMGAVYHAYDENLGIDVAVKENLFLSAEYSKQFQREANILASLRHPNLPHVIDYLILPSQGQYLIMDYINGEDLRQRLERVGQLPADEVILIGAAICDALTYLHSRFPPIIHRDIKPGNIKITPEGSIFLVDFGLAKIMLGDQATSTGARAMTPGYSPPEQYGSASTDARSDVYSLGATLYAALIGAIPEDALARAMGKVQLTPVQALRPDVDPNLAGVIEKALAVEPSDRYQTAELFQQALLIAGGIPVSSSMRITVPPPPPVSPATNPFKRKRFPSSPRNKSNRRTNWLIAGTLLLSVFVIALAFLRPLSNKPAIIISTPSQTPNLVKPTSTLAAGKTGVPTVPIPTEHPLTTLPSQPSPTATNASSSSLGQMAYASDASGSMQIWLMDGDGNNAVQLTHMEEGACQPDWSPDGIHLAFISPCIQKQVDYAFAQIYMMDVTSGAEPEVIPIPSDPAGDYDPAWSPDGKKLAFTSLRKINPNIFVYDFDTGDLVNYSADKKVERRPAWSPDGKWLAYVRGNANTEIWIVSSDLEDRERFTVESTMINSWPIWSADGKMIYYTQYDDRYSMPRLMGLRFEDRNYWGAEYRIPLTPPPRIIPIVDVSLSPNNQWFAFESWPDGFNHDIYTMTISGAKQTRITTAKSFEFCPAWRPILK